MNTSSKSIILAIIIIFIGYSVFLALGSQEGFPEHQYNNGFFPFISEKPLTEDGFYSLEVSWNIASGKGITYNANIPTTGFQPLSVFIQSGLAKLIISMNGDKYTFARSVIIFSALIQVIFVFLIYLIALQLVIKINKVMLFLVCAISVLFNFKLFINFTNGLETGLYITGLAFLLLIFLRVNNNVNKKESLLFGIISGILILIRTDFIIILGTLLLIIFIKKEISLAKIFIVLISALLVTSPWIIFVDSITESLFSSSILVQTGIITSYALGQRIDSFFSSVLHNFTPFLYTGIKIKVIFYTLAIIYTGFVIFFLKKYYQQLFLRNNFKNS